MGTKQVSLTGSSVYQLRSDDHDLSPNWAWSDAVSEWVRSRISEPSLKICTGLTPIAGTNLDIKMYRFCSECEEPRSPESHVCPECDSELTEVLPDVQGDMFTLNGIERNEYETTVSDPPWKDMSASEREDIFEQALRVTAVEGTVIYNSPWIPEHDNAELIEAETRQEGETTGNPSFLLVYRVLAEHLRDLCDYWEYDLLAKHLPDSEELREQHIGVPQVVSRIEAGARPEDTTDVRCLDPTAEAYRCPMCGSADLGHGSGDGHVPEVYSCHECGFPAHHSEVEQLATKLTEALKDQNCQSVTDIENMDWTHPALERFAGKPLDVWPSETTPALPWAPEPV